jgi:predicted Fe-Mo cluster-binding NifX family protein
MTDLQVEMHTRNFGHAVDVAKILKMPYLNIHTPLDELGRRIISEKIAETAEDSTIEDVISTLSKLPEFRKSDTKIETRLGDSTNKAGNIVVSHGAGTNGGYRIAKTYFEHGIQTLVYIHISPGDLEKLKSDGVGNLLITGHIASDSVGINPFISELENNDVSVSRIGIIPP